MLAMNWRVARQCLLSFVELSGVPVQEIAWYMVPNFFVAFSFRCEKSIHLLVTVASPVYQGASTFFQTKYDVDYTR